MELYFYLFHEHRNKKERCQKKQCLISLLAGRSGAEVLITSMLSDNVLFSFTRTDYLSLLS